MDTMSSQITSLTIGYSTHQSSASLAFVRGIHRGPMNSPPKWPVTRKMFPSDDVIMYLTTWMYSSKWKSTLCNEMEGLSENRFSHQNTSFTKRYNRHVSVSNISLLNQGWFKACTQPMRDVVTKWHRLSLFGRKPRISPVNLYCL